MEVPLLSVVVGLLLGESYLSRMVLCADAILSFPVSWKVILVA